MQQQGWLVGCIGKRPSQSPRFSHLRKSTVVPSIAHDFNVMNDFLAYWYDFSFSMGLYRRVLEREHASFIESVPFKYIAAFTLFQFVYLLLCFGITWIPIAGILFPLPFFILISIRQHLLPRLLPPHYLRELDAAEYEEIAGTPRLSLNISQRVSGRRKLLLTLVLQPSTVSIL